MTTTTITADVGLALQMAAAKDPADDLARLAYADWLEETGQQEHADYVRLSLRVAAGATLHRCVPCRDADEAGRPADRARCRCDRGWLADRARLAEVLNSGDPPRGRLWAGPLLRWIVPVQWDYRRGMVARLALLGADWLAHGRELARLHPLEDVRIEWLRPHRLAGTGLWEWQPGDVTEAFPWDRDDAERGVAWLDVLRLRDRVRRETYRRHYEGEEQALRHLSGVLLAWARGEGGE